MAGAATFPSRSIPGRICWRRPSGGSLVEVQSLDASLAEQTWEVGIRAGTNPFFFGYPDPPELEQYESIVPEVTTVSLFSLIAMSKEIRCKPLVEVKSCCWPKSSRASLAPHLCRVRGDFTLRLSPVAAVGALSPSLPCSLRISVKSVTADPGASTPCASPGLG